MNEDKVPFPHEPHEPHEPIEECDVDKKIGRKEYLSYVLAVAKYITTTEYTANFTKFTDDKHKANYINKAVLNAKLRWLETNGTDDHGINPDLTKKYIKWCSFINNYALQHMLLTEIINKK